MAEEHEYHGEGFIEECGFGVHDPDRDCGCLAGVLEEEYAMPYVIAMGEMHESLAGVRVDVFTSFATHARAYEQFPD